MQRNGEEPGRHWNAGYISGPKIDPGKVDNGDNSQGPITVITKAKLMQKGRESFELPLKVTPKPIKVTRPNKGYLVCGKD